MFTIIENIELFYRKQLSQLQFMILIHIIENVNLSIENIFSIKINDHLVGVIYVNSNMNIYI